MNGPDAAVARPAAAAYPYRGPPALRVAIEGALRQVVGLELAPSIVDVGLVHADRA